MTIDEGMQRSTDVCRLKHHSYAREKSYQGRIQSSSRALREIPGGWSSEEKAGTFLTQIAKRGAATATQSQALCALVFLYVFKVMPGTVTFLPAMSPT